MTIMTSMEVVVEMLFFLIPPALGLTSSSGKFPPSYEAVHPGCHMWEVQAKREQGYQSHGFEHSLEKKIFVFLLFLLVKFRNNFGFCLKGT